MTAPDPLRAALALAGDPRELLVGGTWRRADGGRTLPLVDPSTGAPLAEIADGSAADVDAAVAAARAVADDRRAGGWARTPAAERGRLLAAIARAVEAQADALAAIEAQDVGKPLRQGRADALALARYLAYYAGAAEQLMGETIPFADGYTAFTVREPHGVTGHIVPWNYPMQIIGRSVGASLAAGNACVLKPAEDACLTALAFARIAQGCGLPPGVLNVVSGRGETAGAALAGHGGVDHVSFTGSVAVGRAVQAAAARHTVPVTLELGGKSPQIVFADADLDAALPFLVNAGIQNAGQTCSAASRILVQRPVYEQVVARMAERYRALRVGPAATDPDVGPLISAVQRDRVAGFLALARDLGLPVLAQSALPDDLPRGGFWLPPTLLGPVPAASPLAQDEVFGPVQAVLPFDDEDEAVAIADGTDYGLVAGVWTADGGRALRLARTLRCGQVFVNNYGAGGGIELPFGGVKRSGHGREKGFEALHGFTRLKTVAIRHG